MFFAERDSSAGPSINRSFAGALPREVQDAAPIDLWDAWLFAEADASLSLHAWFAATPEDKAQTHHAYQAALDREEQAARVLAQRAATWLPQGDGRPVAGLAA